MTLAEALARFDDAWTEFQVADAMLGIETETTWDPAIVDGWLAAERAYLDAYDALVAALH
jgi:hypothetical protein